MRIEKILISEGFPRSCDLCTLNSTTEYKNVGLCIPIGVFTYPKEWDGLPKWCPLELEQKPELLTGFSVTIRGSGTPEEFQEFAKRLMAELKPHGT